MRRIWLPLFVSVVLAACGSAPQQAAHKPAVSASTTPRAYKPPSGFPNFVDHSVGREEISIQAMSLVGVPYRWGGNTPEAGFDCSGLVRYVVDRAASVNLPRTTAEMSGRGESIEPDEVAPGDLIFFNTTGRPHSHVGIYVGKLRFVNAPSTGGTVRLDYLTNPYWAKRFDGIRRVAPPKTAPTPFDGPTYVAGRGVGSEEAASPRQPVPATASAIAVERPSTSIGAAQLQTSAASAYAGRTPVSATTTGASVASAYGRQKPAATTGADPFEPPAASMNAAQRQSSAAASAYARRTPAASASADPFEPPPASLSAAQRQSSAAASAYARQTPAAAGSADAFEPPLASSSAAQRQSSAAASAYARQTPAASASADAFEPPPASLSAAQRQSSAAASAYARQTPAASASADAFEPPPASLSAAQRQSQHASARTTASASQAPDPIQAAADAYEPPPPLSRAARQQAQAAMASQAAEPPVRAMRASTGSLTPPRAASNDDPIARFATGAD
nr:NlpC/P60 family protein [Caballeronia sp. GAFFF1]